MIHIKTPFRVDKNLGKAYNEAFEGVPEDDWVCLIDYDVMFLTPGSIPLMYKYIEAFPDTGIFICFTNRIHHLAVDQLLTGVPSNNVDVRFWYMMAKAQQYEPISVKEITHEISGFLMVISKKTWNEIKFLETGQALGVDNYFSQAVLASGKVINRMNTLIVWHSYRLNDIRDKSHLF